MTELELNAVQGYFSFYTERPMAIAGAPGKAKIFLRSLEDYVEVEGVVLVGRPEELPEEFSAYFEETAQGSRLNPRMRPEKFERMVRTIYESVFANYVRGKGWNVSGLLGNRSLSGEEVAEEFLRYGSNYGIPINNPSPDHFFGLGCMPVPVRGKIEELTYNNRRIDIILCHSPLYRVKIGMFSEEDAEKLKTFIKSKLIKNF